MYVIFVIQSIVLNIYSFECHRATKLWHIVEDAYQITVCCNNIVCGLKDYDLVFNHVVTLLAFLLYKEWLLMSLENKNPIIFTLMN